MEKLVSVLVPSYNHEKYISDTIKSVLNQTYKNIELIVEDDCSTDKTRKIIKEIKDERLKVVLPKKNKGTVRTINHLLQICHGDYIAILGSDDVWYPTKLEEQIKEFKNKKIGAVFSIADIIDENGEKYFDDEDFSAAVFKKENMSSGKRLRLFYNIGNHLCHSSSVVTRKVLEEVGLYNPLYRQLHDFEYWVRVANKYDVVVVDKPLLAYRRAKSNASLSANTITNKVRIINEYNDIITMMFKTITKENFIEGFKDLFINKKATSEIDLICEKYFILLNMNIFGVKNKLPAINLLSEQGCLEEVIDKLESTYHYSLNDIYNDMGMINEMYPLSLMLQAECEVKNEISKTKAEIQDCRKELEDIYCSKSWKITRPLRKFMEMMRNAKHRD